MCPHMWLRSIMSVFACILTLYVAGTFADGTSSVILSGSCHTMTWNTMGIPWDKGCPTGTVEVSRDVVGHGEPNPHYRRICCDPSHRDYSSREAYSCRTTKCLNFGQRYCNNLDARFLPDGVTELIYEQTQVELCDNTNEATRATALCCVKNTTEGQTAIMTGVGRNEFPHMAMLLSPELCGGAVYNSRYVITSASCVTDSNSGIDKETEGMLVVLGSNIGNVKGSKFLYKVVRVHPHPNYCQHQSEHCGFQNDIALVELDRDIQFGQLVQALRISSRILPLLNYSDYAVSIGWRRYSSESVLLQKANIPLNLDRGEDCYFNSSLHVASGGSIVCRGSDGKASLCGISALHSNNKTSEEKYDHDEGPSFNGKSVSISCFHDWIQGIAGVQEQDTLYQPYLYGKDIQPGQYDHEYHVHIIANGVICWGTLIAPNIVVTLAECVTKDNSFGDDHVALHHVTITNGTIGLNEKRQTFIVNEVKVSPSFPWTQFSQQILREMATITTANYFHNTKIAVITLAEAVSDTPGTFPSLPPMEYTSLHRYEYVRATRFTIAPMKREPDFIPQLREREIDIMSYSECQIRINRVLGLESERGYEHGMGLLCGMELFSGGSICDTQLGDGLICKGENGQDVLCGIGIFHSCQFPIPVLFVDMRYYLHWLSTVLAI